MYLNEELGDVYFIVGRDNEEKERIVAHKFILSIGSSVFNAMFYGTGQQMDKSNEIEIPDVDSRSFKCFLRYLYTDEIIIEPETVMSILYVSKKYSVINLENASVEFLKSNLRIDNAFMLLQQAKLFDEMQLADLCLDLIDKYSSETFSSDCFLEIDLQLLKLVLKRDSLSKIVSKRTEQT
jgi:BTB/POZ domain-containing protein 1/2